MEVLQKSNEKDLRECCNNKESSVNCNIDNVLTSIILKEGYINYEVYKRFISSDGGNYCGVLHEIDIKGETEEGYKETFLFVKRKLSNIGPIQFLNFGDIFSKEAYIYSRLNKIFNNLQEEAGIPLNNRYNMAKAYDGSDKNMIVLENLTKKGYRTLNRMEVTPLKFMELSITQLAKFHGLSLVLNKKMPNYFEKNKELFTYNVSFNDQWQAFVKNISTQVIKDLESDIQEKITNILPTVFEKLPKYVTGELASVKCLCHGDYRINNIMVKEKDGELIDVVPVDYQLVFLGSPVTDLMYLVFSGAERKFRKTHLEYMKDLYYNNLKEFLGYFQIDGNSVYSRTQFEQDYKDHYDYGLFITLWLCPFFFAEAENEIDFEKDDITNVELKSNETLKKRIEEVFQDYIDEGYL